MTKTLNFTNYSKLAKGSDRNDVRYDWCVFLDEEQEVLATIAYVKYILHPTFINPERIATNMHDRFAIYSNGWGTFMIRIEVGFKNKEIQKTEYYLDLEPNDWPLKTAENVSLDNFSGKVYAIIADSDFEWRKKSTIITKSRLSPMEVDASIEQLEKLNLIRKAHYKSIDHQELYGVTSKVGIRPEVSELSEW